MPHNAYDNAHFFAQYARMPRSQQGLAAAGEWQTLQRMLPDFSGKRVLDLGCGFGWHCIYAMEHGAASAIGLDCSTNMLEQARAQTHFAAVRYLHMPIEDMDFERGAFDVVISSLALHYVPSFEAVCRKVCHCLVPNGDFVFSVEHPIFTAQGSQDWHCDATGKRLHWPVDRYATEGPRTAHFLGVDVIKYHKTLTTYMQGLLHNGFTITHFAEPLPPDAMCKADPTMEDERRRPMMLLVAARREGEVDSTFHA